MDVTGIGPYIKRNGAFKMMIQGTGFARGDTVTLAIRVGGPTGTPITRTGTVLRPVTGGCIANIGPNVGEVKDADYDEDLAEVTVTVTSATGSTDSATEPGVLE